MKISYNYEDKTILIRFLTNEAYQFVKIPSLAVISSSNCIIREEQTFMIENPNFIQFSESIVNFKKTPYGETTDNSISTANFLASTFIPDKLVEFLQFNEFFSHLSYLNINGGKIFNFFSTLSKDFDNKDKWYIDDKLIYEYHFI